MLLSRRTLDDLKGSGSFCSNDLEDGGLAPENLLTAEQLSTPVALRHKESSKRGMLGTCCRNPLTGKSILKNGALADFCIVDLWERTALYGTPEDLIRDPYLFKIEPLVHRTWMYHYYFGDMHEMSSKAGEHALLDEVLNSQAVDTAKGNFGLWSPAICYTPATFASILTKDWPTVFFMCACFL